MSIRLVTVLQTAAFPFRHCTIILAPHDGIDPPSARSERAVLPLNEWGVVVCAERFELPLFLYPKQVPYQPRRRAVDWPSRQESNLHAFAFVARCSSG